MAAKARDAFLKYNFGEDQDWFKFVQTQDFGGAADRSKAELILRQRYFKLMNDDYEIVPDPYSGSDVPFTPTVTARPSSSTAPSRRARGKLPEVITSWGFSEFRVWYGMNFIASFGIPLFLASIMYPRLVLYSFSFCMPSALFARIFNLFLKHGFPQFNKQWFQPLNTDHDFHYALLILAMTGTYSTVAVLVICLLCLLEVCVYAPRVFLNPPLANLAKSVNALVKPHIPRLLVVVAQTELVLLVSLLITGQFIAFFMCAMFLLLHYTTSVETRNVVDSVAATLDHYAFHERCPGVIRQVYSSVKGYIAQMGNPYRR